MKIDLKNKLIQTLLLSLLMFSCNSWNREKPVDKKTLLGYDYRLFQGTPAWTLSKAVQDKDIDKINETIINNRNLINYQEPRFGQTLLMLTIRNNNYKSFKCLLSLNANVNIHDSYMGSSALIIACKLGGNNIKYALDLIEHGANVNDVETGRPRDYTNSTRYTPLMAAAESNRMDLVELLIIKNANVNYENEFHQSALSKALWLNQYRVSLYLIQHGADINKPILYRGDTPVNLLEYLNEDHYALSKNEDSCRKQIISYIENKR